MILRIRVSQSTQNNNQFLMDLLWLILIIPVAFWIISAFFLCFPNILHKRYRYRYQPFNDLATSNKVLCIGHRGGGYEGPQNTLQTFSKNLKHSHMFELDVCITKDKKLVVHHDHHLQRLCGVGKDIQDLNADEMPPYLDEILAFGTHDLMIKTEKNRIPLLDTVFESFPEQPMNIEIKTPSKEAIEEFDRLVRKHKREHITIWGTTGKLSEELLIQNPDTICFYTAGEVIKIFLLFITGLLPFWCIRQGIIDIPLMSDGLYRFAMRIVGDSCGRQCLVVVVYLVVKLMNFTSMFWIPHLKKRGILTFYWIVNNEEDFDNAIVNGCSGIMTDVTSDLASYLQGRGLYYGQQGNYLQS